MGKTLILTEKYSVAQDYAKVLNVNPEKNGKIENDKYVITWCVGHLIEMAYPEMYDEKYKKWNMEDLPFIPEKYIFNVKLKERYNVVREQLHRKDIDTVLFCGDSGREGEYIYRLILLKSGMRSGMNALRVWIDSTTAEAIKMGIKNAKPISEYNNIYAAAMQRGIEDYLVGMNFSRALTVKYGKKFNSMITSEKWKSIDVGRVMSCVLGMVVRKEREIENFKVTPFYKLQAKIGNIEAEWKADEKSQYYQSNLLYKDIGFLDREDAEHLRKEQDGKEGVLESVETYLSNKNAPLLFNLAELQNECTEKYKISPDETLAIAQFLYENALITYPRTDARVLSSAIAKEILTNISGLQNYQLVQPYVQEILDKQSYLLQHGKGDAKRYVDDSKITDHYAIIPTGNLEKIGQLNSMQKNIYELIVKRFLSIFYPPAVYQNTKICLRIGNEGYYAAKKYLLNPGYMTLYGDDADLTENNKTLESIKEKKGSVIGTTQVTLKDGSTTPPKRYTSGSLVLAMENAGNLIDDAELREQIKGSGIGTSATRSTIIQKLIDKEYICVNKKTQIVQPHKDGFIVYDIINSIIPDFLSPDITAEWEKKLSSIADGTLSSEVHQKEVEDYVKQQVAFLKSLNNGENYTGKKFESAEICKCPACNGIVRTTSYGYACSNYKKEDANCYFAIGKIAGKKIESVQVQKLCQSGATDVLKGFKSKKGSDFSAALKLSEKEGKKVIEFDFEKKNPEYLENIVCPLCKGKLRKTSFGYGCENYKKEVNSCLFTVNNIIAKKAISESQIKKLLSEGETDVIKGFTSKTGKKFDAALQLDEGKIIFKFKK